MKPVFGLVLLLSVASLSHAYYYNEEGEVEDDGFAESSGRARSLYTRSIKSAPLSPSRKSYTPPSPSRARLSAPAPAVKGYEPQQQQRFEQQTYEAQSQVPKINHEVVGRPEPFNFNYDVKDDYGNSQYRREDSDDSGAVRGSYGYTDANGLYRIVDYVADDNGFRATIRTNEPGLVEPSPATGEVLNPADVILNAEATPAGVREQQQRYAQQSNKRGGGGGGSSLGGGSSSYGGGGSTSSSSYGGSSSQSSYGGGSQSSFGGGQSSFGGGSNYASQQKLSSGRSGTKY